MISFGLSSAMSIVVFPPAFTSEDVQEIIHVEKKSKKRIGE